MAVKLPLHPAHPERICWGCDKYCAADDLRCGNGTDRAQHPIEILGPDWLDVGLDAELAVAERGAAEPAVAAADDRARGPAEAGPERATRARSSG